MTTSSRIVIWFNRLVLAAATFVMLMIAVRNLRDPIGATLPLDIVLRSPSAVTIVRVGYRFIATQSKNDAPAFFGREMRYGHRIYGAVVVNAIR
jgi:hypothetical protein